MKVLDDRQRRSKCHRVTHGWAGWPGLGEEELGRIGMVSVPDTNALRKLGDGLIDSGSQTGRLTRADDSTLWQGYLESSTVEPVLEMAGLVEIGRAVEANAKLMQAQDLLTGQAINTFGKVT